MKFQKEFSVRFPLLSTDIHFNTLDRNVTFYFFSFIRGTTFSFSVFFPHTFLCIRGKWLINTSPVFICACKHGNDNSMYSEIGTKQNVLKLIPSEKVKGMRNWEAEETWNYYVIWAMASSLSWLKTHTGKVWGIKPCQVSYFITISISPAKFSVAVSDVVKSPIWFIR